MAFTKINAAGIGSTETVTLDGLTVINDGSFGGNVSVGGTLTYEDVTNIDSVGLITARAGVVVGSGITLSQDGDIFATGITTVSGNIKVGTGITLSPDGDGFFTGVVTATTFKGDGAQLSNVTSTTINNNADNRLITGSGTANTLNGEANFTFDGTSFTVGASGNSWNTITRGDLTHYSGFHFNDSGSSRAYLGVSGATNHIITGSAQHDVALRSESNLLFAAGGATERLRIDSSGRLLINTTTNRDKYFNGTYTGQLQVEGTNDATRLSQFIFNNSGGGGHILVIGKSRGTTTGSYDAVADTNYLGTISFQGADGDEMVDGARIEVQVNGTPSNDNMPADMIFRTNSGSASPTERLRINSTGAVVKQQFTATNTYSANNTTQCGYQAQNLSDTTNTYAALRLTAGTTSPATAQIAAIRTGAGQNDLTFQLESSNTAFEALRMTSGGQVRIGNENNLNLWGQNQRLQVAGTNWETSGISIAKMANNANTANIILGASRGSTPGTAISNGDRLGYISFVGDDGTDMGTVGAAIVSGTDDAPSSNSIKGTLQFDTNGSERMRIASSGDFYFGAVGDPHSNDGGTSAIVKFNYGTDAANYAIETCSDSIPAIFNKTQGNGVAVEIKKDATVVGSITVSGSTCQYNTSSDYRLKENVVNLTDGITRVKQLTPRRFNWISDETNTLQDGFLAHEAQAVVPEAVQGVKDEIAGADYKGHSGISEGDPVYQEMDHSKLVPLLTAALKETITEIETLKAKVAALEG